MNSNNQSQNLATPSSGPLKTPEVIALYDCRLAFAVPGEDSLIDLVHPETGNSRIYSESLAEIRKRYPNAEIVNVDEFQAAKAARQNSPIEWTETTSERFNEMLGCLPPAMMTSDGFLVGEPYDHHALTGQPRYQAFVEVNQRFFTSSRPLTRKEFSNGAFPSICKTNTLGPDDLIRPCILLTGHKGFCSTGR